MTKISSGSIPLQKRVFPTAWFGILGLVVAMTAWRGSVIEVLLSLVVTSAMAGAGYLVFRRILWDLADEVYDCEDHLLVRKSGLEERVPIRNLKNVSYTMSNPPRIVLRLITPGHFGSEIAFVPVDKRGLLPSSSNAVADDLIERTFHSRS